MNRMVTIPTVDHGDVAVSCPAWCSQEYHQAGGYRVDITHSSPDVDMLVPTGEGPTVLLRHGLEERPFSEPHGVHAHVELDGRWYQCSEQQLDDLAAGLVEAARELRSLARRLAVLKETGR